MTKIFVVTAGDYSDYHIVGAFSTRKIAEEYRYKLGADWVEEYEIDEITNSLYSGGYTRYYVSFNGDTTIVEEHKSTYENDHLDMKYVVTNRSRGAGNMNVYLFARDEQHAVKIASEVRSQIIASGVIEQFFTDNPKQPLFESYFGYTDDELKPESDL